MFDLKQQFEQYENDSTAITFETGNPIDNFLTNCTINDYERDFESNMKEFETFQNVDTVLNNFSRDVKNSEVSYESALQDLSEGLVGTGISLDDLGLGESIGHESAVLTVEAADSWYVRLWNWIKAKIKGMYDWFMGLFDSNEAKLDQAEKGLKKLLSDEDRYDTDKNIILTAINKNDWETLEDLLDSSTKDFPDLIKLVKEALANKDNDNKLEKVTSDLKESSNNKNSDEQKVYWNNVKNIPGAGIIFKKDIGLVSFRYYLEDKEEMAMRLIGLIEKYLSSIDNIPTSKEVNEINIKSNSKFDNFTKKVNSFFNIVPSDKTPYIYISKYTAPDTVTTSELSYENGKFTEEKKSYTHPNIPDKEVMTFSFGSSVIENMKKDISEFRKTNTTVKKIVKELSSKLESSKTISDSELSKYSKEQKDNYINAIKNIPVLIKYISGIMNAITLGTINTTRFLLIVSKMNQMNFK
jgi:hypothetical protein